MKIRVVFSCNEIVVLNIDLNNINFNNFDEDGLDNIILIRILAWHIRFEKRKELKKNVSEELRKSYSETYSKRRFIFRNRFEKTSYYPQQPTIFSYCC